MNAQVYSIGCRDVQKSPICAGIAPYGIMPHRMFIFIAAAAAVYLIIWVIAGVYRHLQ
ncbi:hypothetical protein [Dehalogenimonas sp. 4OHTPN]|uniref:Uncharacterized protein n=1 Tax=Dehalogenimonas sp. 4OHTPN TaxID=3166643 RepID=A0AAU8GBT8_9CHLR